MLGSDRNDELIIQPRRSSAYAAATNTNLAVLSTTSLVLRLERVATFASNHRLRSWAGMGGTKEGPMFTNLRVGAKPCILRGTSIISIAVTICARVRDKQTAIEFACRKLTRTRYLATVREIYAVTVARQAEAANFLRPFRANQVAAANAIVGDILARAWTACSCIGDDSTFSSATDADDDVEATSTVTERVQSLSAKLAIVPMTAHDSPSGIDRENVEHILYVFLTTRSNGVCMGLLICCSIIEARDGGPSGVEGELVFQVALPVGNFGNTQ
jgi:hypothetical protein